eukprot:3105938-Rhodomonas_salina.1
MSGRLGKLDCRTRLWEPRTKSSKTPPGTGTSLGGSCTACQRRSETAVPGTPGIEMETHMECLQSNA